MSFLPEVREMTLFVRLELVSQVLVECWLLSNLQKFYSLTWAHFWKYGLLFGVQGTGVSFRPGLHCCWVEHEVVSHLAIKTGPCVSTRELQGHFFLLRFFRLLLNVWNCSLSLGNVSCSLPLTILTCNFFPLSSCYVAKQIVRWGKEDKPWALGITIA